MYSLGSAYSFYLHDNDRQFNLIKILKMQLTSWKLQIKWYFLKYLTMNLKQWLLWETHHIRRINMWRYTGKLNYTSHIHPCLLHLMSSKSQSCKLIDFITPIHSYLFHNIFIQIFRTYMSHLANRNNERELEALVHFAG